MKLTALFIIVSFITMHAKETYGQKPKISLNFTNITVNTFISEIESKTDFRFVFKISDVNLDKHLSIHVKNEPIDFVLDQVFKHSNTNYKIINKRIYLIKTNTRSSINKNSNQTIVQDLRVQGKVMSKDGFPLPGATVVEKGTSNGSSTDFEGRFELSVSKIGVVLTVSYVGYKTQEIVAKTNDQFDVFLEEETSFLEEVVVTALGIKQEKKALGYSSQDIAPEELVESKETNFVNGLSGKIAGVNVTNSPTGIGGSSLITIRGASSLDISKNSPLFIVDGTPISNDYFSPTGDSTSDVDYGNGAGEINPQNIESVNILKGPAAAAIYGSRAANGAIVITTKKGRGDGKLKVNISSGITFENPLTMPDWQNEYGQGNNDAFSFVDGSGGGVNDGLDESWGPKLDTGLLIAQFDSPREDGTRGGDVDVSNANIIPTPWVSNPDNVRDFFETGYTKNNSIALSKSGDFGNFRIAYQNLNQEGIVPNTDLSRNNFNLSTGINLTKSLKVNANINYLKQDSGNRPSVSYGTENVMYMWVWYGRQINTNSLRNYWQEGLEGIQQFNYNYNYHDNAYFNVFENTNSQDKDRVYGNVSLDYNLNKHFKLILRTGRDFYRDFRAKKRAYSTQRFPNGYYREDNIFYEEVNTDFLLSYDNTYGKWDVNLSFGGNRLNQNRNYDSTRADELINPGVYSFNNAGSQIISIESDYKKRVNSLYGFGRFSFDNKIYFEVSARNDWSSTLPKNDNSYFYPSANVSVLLNEVFSLPQVISFAKIRGAFAAVGNDTDPYKNGQPTYTNGGTYAGNPILSESAAITNGNLKPENTVSYEFGTDLRFWGNALTLDAAVYKNSTTNQILDVPADISSGYDTRSINLGKVENQGLEVTLGLKPFNKEKFKWNAFFNFSKNESRVSDLGGVDYTIAENKAYIQAREGGSISAMYGIGLKRVDDQNSPYYGEVIYDTSGLPLRTSDLEYQGDYAPDFTLGIQNTFKIRNFDFGFFFDYREGGMVVSRTKVVGSAAGQIKETLVGRESGIIGDGVVEVSPGVFQPNETLVSARTYYKSYNNSNNVETSKYDASYVKLREVSIGYNLSSKFCSSISIDDLRLSLSGRNLALWTENPHFDPETVMVSGGVISPGYEYMSLPSTRSFTFNININF
ncbi:SusC/RagA family TonB-linked outer membrane protein [Pseudotamlana agarivorans]|uniref:SusC/RagA family TonB-linked outer membrane protein n=1 Tax=Pseudotamlana agarivorans TaxID=481183 RepID=UPI001FE0BBE4|nr:SusC/RagA family TonB-linked outer membrane protein [Tamlana agarivorans]